MSSQLFRRAALSAALVSGLVAAAARAEDKAPVMGYASGVSVITTPSETRHLQFPTAGIIRESSVKDGDRVQAGQLLMKQDTDLDAEEADRLKVEAESDSKVDAAKADRELKRIERDRKRDSKNYTYPATEVEEAEAKFVEADKSVNVAQEDKQQAKIKYDEQMTKVQKMSLHCPDDVKGEWIVQKLNFSVGEMADPQNKDGVMVIVKNDPLYVEIRGLTTKQVETLKKGDTLQVRYQNDLPDAWKDATINYITPVADAGADRQLVRLSLPNPDNHDAGLRMELKMTPKLQQTAPKDDGMLSFK